MTVAAHFDHHVTDMQRVTADRGTFAFAYERQVAYLQEAYLEPGLVVLDVGCGPSLPYDDQGAYIIGLDPSAASLAVNTDVDDRIVGSAENISLPDRSVDLVVAFYSLHHMTGQTARETYLIRARALSEMRRVVKDGGNILVFEMAPNPLAQIAQAALWPTARRLLGDRLDTYFWGDEEIEAALPRSEVRVFDAPPFMTFPPIFELPWLKIPRFLYPLTPVLYSWEV